MADYEEFTAEPLPKRRRREMYNYKLSDVNGKVLGVISLETEELPKEMIDGAHFALGVAYRLPDKKIFGMTVAPIPVSTKEGP